VRGGLGTRWRSRDRVRETRGGEGWRRMGEGVRKGGREINGEKVGLKCVREGRDGGRGQGEKRTNI